MDAISQLQSRSWPEEGAARVPFWVYSDQNVYDREQERIFSGPNWSYVALEAEIPNPYDFIRANIGDKPVVVTRDGNASRATGNSCLRTTRTRITPASFMSSSSPSACSGSTSALPWRWTRLGAMRR